MSGGKVPNSAQLQQKFYQNFALKDTNSEKSQRNSAITLVQHTSNTAL
jgi:hypothetical protein